jgi:predicted transcriptional regulator
MAPIGRDDTAPGQAQDDRVEAAVLRQLLALHPTQLTVEELARELGADPEDFAQRDAVERAVRDLSRTGLLHRSGELAAPSRAALRFNELLDR